MSYVQSVGLLDVFTLNNHGNVPCINAGNAVPGLSIRASTMFSSQPCYPSRILTACCRELHAGQMGLAGILRLLGNKDDVAAVSNAATAETPLYLL